MAYFWQQPWFVTAVVVAVAVPVVIVVLTEIIGALAARQHPAVKPLRLLRNYVVPSVAVLVLSAIAEDNPSDLTGVRIVATIVGFLTVLLILSAFNAALFGTPADGSWRARVPSIFVDIVRLLLALTGLAVLFSVVWGTDVAGLFAALGVTSIVLGLALQGAIGSVVSGLLLLFEQPFRLGDLIDTGTTRGRVVEVNWRSVHVQTDGGIRIIPNAALAESVFTNHSRSTDGFFATSDFLFAKADAPRRVIALLERVALDLPGRRPDALPVVTYNGEGSYTVSVPVQTLASISVTSAVLRETVWYAARRATILLVGQVEQTGQADEEATSAVGTALLLPDEVVLELAPRIAVETYAPGEILQRNGIIAEAVRVILRGRIRYETVTEGLIPNAILELEAGEFLGQTSLTRQPSVGRYIAAEEVVVARIAARDLDPLLARVPSFARTIGLSIDVRRGAIRTSQHPPARGSQ